MRTFIITFEVPQTKLATIVELLGGEVNALRVEQIGRRKEEPAPAPRHRKRRTSRIEDALRAMIAKKAKGEEFYFSEAAALMPEQRLAPSSASPGLGALAKAGIIEIIGKGKYRVL